MTDTRWLEDRLRTWATLDKIEAGPVLAHDLNRAAYELGRLRHQVKDLREMQDDRAWCSDCGSELEHVRPGKYQCNHCEQITGVSFAEVVRLRAALEPFAGVYVPALEAGR